MKRFQKVLSVVLTAAMLLGLFAGFSVAYAATVTSDSGTCGTGVSYRYYNGELSVYSSGGTRMNDYDPGSAPWHKYAGEIRSLSVDGIQYIGRDAFSYLSNCSTYTISDMVTEIGSFAFFNNTAMTTITMNRVMTIGTSAFAGCSALIAATYPSAASVAAGNDTLVRVSRPGGSSNTGTSPTIPSESLLLSSGTSGSIRWKVYNEGTLVITPATSGQTVYMAAYPGSNAPWMSYASSVDTIIVTDGVASVGDNAFYNMGRVESVLLGSNVASIGMYAFMGCSSLKRIEFSATTRAVSDYAFYNCNLLSQVVTPLTVNQMTITNTRGGNDPLINAMTTSSGGNTGGGSGTVIPPSASASGQIAGTNITWALYAGVLTITSTKAGGEAIQNYAPGGAPWYLYASQITSVKLNGITQIGTYAFAGLTALATVDLGSTATAIQSNAFNGALSLHSLNLPASLRYIYSNAFAGAGHVIITTPNPQVLMTVDMSGNNITMQYNYNAGTPIVPGPGTTPGGTITPGGDIGTYAPTGSCGSGVYYSYNETTKKLTISGNGDITAQTSVLQYPWFGFSGSIQEIEILAGVRSIPARAFYIATDLTTLIIPSTVTSIGDYAFNMSSKLTTATIDNIKGAVSIGEGNITLNSVVTYLKAGEVTPPAEEPEGIKSNGIIDNTDISWSFDASTGELLVRSTKIGGEEMPNFSSYNNAATYGGNVAPWAHLAPFVKKVSMQGITHVGMYAFSDMTALTTVNFAGTTTSIGRYAFARDTKITHLTFPAALTLIHDSAFENCSMSTVATTPLVKDVTIHVGANNNITIQYQSSTSSNAEEGYIVNTSIFWSYDKNTRVLTIESTAGTEDLPGVTMGSAPWQSVAAQVVSIKMRGIKSIGSYAFYDMPSLTSVDFAAETTAIGVGAFMKASSLRSLTFTPLLTTIASYAFEDCNVTATTSKTQGSISVGYNNSGLTIIYNQNPGGASGTNIPGSSIYWTYNNGVLTIYSLATAGEPLKDFTDSTLTPWNSYRSSITKVVMSGITRIGRYAFANMTYLKEVVYANNTEAVASYAFANCNSLKSQSLPASLTQIFDNAYFNCTNLSTSTPNAKGQMMLAESGNQGLVWTWGQGSGSGSGSGNTQTTTSGVISSTSISWDLNVATGVLTLTSALPGGEPLPDSPVGGYPWSEDSLNSYIKKIVLRGITGIGVLGFSDLTNLAEVSFGDNITSIGRYAFMNASSLKTLYIPASLISIESNAFQWCTNVVINTPNSEAQMIGASGVQNVTFRYGQANPDPGTTPDPGPGTNPDPGTDPDTPPAGPATFGTIEDTSISWVYFSATHELTVSSNTGEALPSFASADKAPWADWADEIVSVRLLNITSIGKYAFAEMPKLASVVFTDDKLTSIDQYAFANAKALKALTLGAAVTKIEANAFAGCTLTIDTPNYQKDVTFSKEGNTGVTWNFKVRDYSAWTSIEDTELEWRVKDNVLSIYGDGSIPNFDSAADTPWAEIAAEIEKISLRGEMPGIGAYAFAGMTKVTEITLPSSVKTIGASAFRGCTALETVSFPTALTAIGDYAFSGCEKLGDLDLPADLASIGREAFYDCSSIAEINFRTTKKLTIGSSAFAGCTALTKAVRLSSAELVIDAVGNEALDKALRPDSASGTTTEGVAWNADCVNGILTLLGSGAITDGSAWTEYLPYINTVIIGNSAARNGITEIGEALFKDATTIETVVLPATVVKIGADAFAGCTALKTIDLPASLVEIGNRAFKNCSALTEIALPVSVTVLPTEVFAGCTSLKKVTTSYLLTTIGQGAFKGCTALETFTIPATVTTLASEAFNGCSALNTLVVAKGGLTTIPNNIFVGCNALKTVYFAGTEAEWTQMTANADAELKAAAYNKAITLTVEYYYNDSTDAAPAVTIVGAPGDVAQVISPVIAHYSTGKPVVETTLSKDETVTVIYNPDSYWLVISYQDTEGNAIEGLPPKRILLYYNEVFNRSDESVLPVVKGYRADRTSIDLGVITGEVEPITVTYELCEYTVNVVQVDQDGKQLSDKVYTFKGLYGSDIEIDLSLLDEIPHYELSDENVYTIKNISADITAEEPYKIVYQKKAYSLTIEFKDEDGFMVDPNKTITVFYGEPVNYEVPSLEDKGYIPLDSILTLEAYNGEESLVARYKIKTFSVELQFVEVNSDGHKMLNSQTVDIVYGTNFIYEIPAINGYVANQAKIDLGIVTTQPEGPIIIEYTPALYDMTIQLFDKAGNSLGSQLVEDIQVGTTYKIALNPVEGYLTDGIVIEGTMGPEDNNKIVSIVLEKVPETEPDPNPVPGPGTDVEPDPEPDPEPDDKKFETIIVLLLVVVVLALAAMIFYVSYMKKRN